MATIVIDADVAAARAPGEPPTPTVAQRSTDFASGYFGRYSGLRMSRDADGILVVRLHTDCRALAFGREHYAELEDAFRRIGRDRRNQVVVLTGSDGDFIPGFGPGALEGDEAVGELTPVLEALANIGVPVIAAIEGRAYAHPEIALMADAIVAGQGALISRSAHVRTLFDVDAVRDLWRWRIGRTRADAVLAHPLPLTASRAQAWGLVDDVVPNGAALARAKELARLYLLVPEPTRRRLRALIVEQLRPLIAPAGQARPWSTAELSLFS